MISPDDERFLRRALRLAMNGRGHVEPNPMVGCVLVKNGQIIGEGWHAKVGEAHAEPNALADCKSRGNDPAGATAYVTLEPCCHTNKRTPPCAPRLIEAKIARVVVGCLDPNPDVNGKGVAMLQAAGIEVEALPELCGTGVPPVMIQALRSGRSAADEPSRAGRPCHEMLDASVFRQLIAPFMLRQSSARPYVTLKWAESLNGVVAGERGRRVQISNAESSRFVHTLRAGSDAIMVGVNTVLNDDPQLNVRIEDPYRRLDQIYVLDSNARTPVNAKLFAANGWVSIVTLAGGSGDPARHDRHGALVESRFQTTSYLVEPDEVGERISLPALFGTGYIAGSHLLVEAGPTLARSFFAAGLCDRLIVIRSDTRIDEHLAPRAADIPSDFIRVGVFALGQNEIAEYLNTRSPAFFAAVPSADFVLASESAS